MNASVSHGAHRRYVYVFLKRRFLQIPAIHSQHCTAYIVTVTEGGARHENRRRILVRAGSQEVSSLTLRTCILFLYATPISFAMHIVKFESLPMEPGWPVVCCSP
jgi:hypothetical protein